jgi:hypothetical protein
MFLQTKDGIMCDLCGSTHKEVFEYYPTETYLVKVVNGMKVGRGDAKFSKDVCSTCYNGILDKVRANVGVFKHGHVKCDLSNTYKAGTFDYYEMFFDKVAVDRNANPSTVVEKRVMDLNLITGFQELTQRAQVISNRVKQGEVWS